MDAVKSIEIQCPLCGYRFHKKEAYHTACSTCPLAPLQGKCGFVRCPQCHYEILLQTPVVSSIQRWIRKIKGE